MLTKIKFILQNAHRGNKTLAEQIIKAQEELGELAAAYLMSKKKKSTTKTKQEVEDNFIIYPPENPLALADVMNDGLLKRIFYENQLSRINNY